MLDTVEVENDKAAAEGGNAKNNFCILVVDDDVVTRELIRAYLQREGYEAEVAEDPIDACRKINEKKFDVIFLDVLLPYMSGLQFMQFLRTQNDETPVILITSKTSTADEIKGLKAGAADYIRKPIHKEILLLRLKNVLERRSPSSPE